MNITKLKSGSYNVRIMIEGKKYSFTFKSKPTQREIDRVLAEKIKTSEETEGKRGTFEHYAKEYIASKNNVLSPSTINSYESIVRNLPNDFLCAQLAQISPVTVQRVINTYSETHSPKSVKNANGFIISVLGMYRPDVQFKIKLPQMIKKETYIPLDCDVQKLIKEIKGNRYEAVILLCMLGLRRSEAMAVTAEDIRKENELYYLAINKALVTNNKKEFVLKTTKTESSTREIVIPEYLAELINKNKKAFEGYPNGILRYLNRTQDKLQIPRCKLHALRHYYISMAHSLGIPDAYISAAVGHSSTATTRRIYLHAQKDKQATMEQKAINFLNI